MSISPTTRLLTAVLMTALLGGCSQEGLSIDDPWIAEAPPTVSAQAGYVLIKNNSGQSRTLIGANAPAFDSIELHRTVQDAESGLTKMVRQERVEIPPGETIKFEPGGYHLMLIKPKKALKEGDREPLTLIFDDKQRLKVEFEVRRERFQL